MGSWILRTQFFLISVGALALAAGVSSTVPTAVNIWSVIHSCLKPPYLHILVNAIILTIAASSRLRRPTAEAPPAHLTSVGTPPPAYFTAYPARPEVQQGGEDEAMEVKAVTMVNGLEVGRADEEGTMSDAGRKLTCSSRRQPPERPTGNIPEMEEKYETLESIWEKIMEGKSRSSHDTSLSSYRIQKETSPSQDELTQRVETFIKKVNNQMKLQRQKSLNQSMDVTNYRV